VVKANDNHKSGKSSDMTEDQKQQLNEFKDFIKTDMAEHTVMAVMSQVCPCYKCNVVAKTYALLAMVCNAAITDMNALNTDKLDSVGKLIVEKMGPPKKC
jgi:hypothetical protein